MVIKGHKILDGIALHYRHSHAVVLSTLCMCVMQHQFVCGLICMPSVHLVRVLYVCVWERFFCTLGSTLWRKMFKGSTVKLYLQFITCPASFPPFFILLSLEMFMQSGYPAVWPLTIDFWLLFTLTTFKHSSDVSVSKYLSVCLSYVTFNLMLFLFFQVLSNFAEREYNNNNHNQVNVWLMSPGRLG